MKKLLIVLSLFMVALTIQAQESVEVVTDVVTTVEETTSMGREIYNDAKEALAQLGEAIGVASEYVYEVLIKQQLVKAVLWLLLILFTLGLFVLGTVLLKKVDDWDEPSVEAVVGIIVLVIAAGFTIACIAGAQVGVTGLVNPEYGALKDVIEMVGVITGKGTPCG